MFGEDLRGKAHVEAPKVDRLAGGVDFCLVRGLGLAEHRRRVERGALGAGEDVGRLQEHAGAVFPAPGRPLAAGVVRGLDGGVDILGTGAVPRGGDMAVLVR